MLYDIIFLRPRIKSARNFNYQPLKNQSAAAEALPLK